MEISTRYKKIGGKAEKSKKLVGQPKKVDQECDSIKLFK